MVSKFTTAIAIALTAVLLDNGNVAAASLRQTAEPVSRTEVALIAFPTGDGDMRGNLAGLEKRKLFLPGTFAVVNAPTSGLIREDQESAYSLISLHRARAATGQSERAPELARFRPR